MDHRLPLGICKQAIMKMESALVDINEIQCDDDIDNEQRETFHQLAEYTGSIIATIYNEVMKEMGEKEFMDATIDMDEIPHWPESEATDILNTEIEGD